MNDSHREEIAKLEALYASNPEGRVFTHLAEAYRKAGQLDRARAILDSGLERHPDYASAHVVLGRVLADAGDQDGSAREFRRVLELDRHNLVALRSLGDLAASRSHAQEALYYYGELAVLDPSDMVIQEEIRRFREHVEKGRGPGPQSGVSEAGAPAGALVAQAPVEGAPAASTEAAEPVAGTGEVAGGPEPVVEAAEAAASGTTPPGDAMTEEQQAERGLDLEGPAPVSLEGLEKPETGLPGAGPDDETSFAGIMVEGMDAAGPEAEAGISPAAGAPPGGEVESTVEFVAFHAEMEFPERVASEELRDEGPEVEKPAAEAEPASMAEPTGGPEGWHGAEGRWEPPAALAADEDAERERETREDTGEWISSDRWKWMAASAGEELPQAAPDADETFEAESEAGAEAAAPPDWLAQSAAPASAEPAVEGFAQAEVDSAEVEEGMTLEAAFTEPLARPVDSFEEGAADVLAAAGLLDEDSGKAGTGDELVSGPVEDDLGVWVASEGAAWDEETDDSGDLVITETLAEIYASQGLIDRAVSVYRRLVREHPYDDRLRNRLVELETAMEPAAEPGAADGFGMEAEAEIESVEAREAWVARVESAFTGGEGAVGSEETPYAWAKAERPEETNGGRIGDYFRSLLAWRPSVSSSATEPEAGPLPDETGPAFTEWAGAGAEPAEPERSAESDEDLEMFRSWLKSLKK